MKRLIPACNNLDMDAQPECLISIADMLRQFGGIELAYLFGSHATGEAGPNSDLDLAILLTDPADRDSLIMQISHHIHKRSAGSGFVDGVDLRMAPLELSYNIIASGVCVYQKDTFTRVEYEAGIMSRYGDYLPILRQQRQEIVSKEGYERRIQRYRKAFGRTQRTLSQITSASK
jgi:predicted nucleotidyltransferase